MVPRLLQRRARAGRRGVFHYEINTPLGVRHRYVSVEAGTCTTSASLERTPNATIGLALHDLVALAVGELKGTDAFVSGRIEDLRRCVLRDELDRVVRRPQRRTARDR